jgi:hypothetical protein
VGLVSCGPLALLAAPRQSRASDFGRFSKAKFESLLGSWMHVDMGVGAGWESVQLVEVLDGPESVEVEQFSIRIRTDPQVELEPRIYTVDTGSSAIELYLEPKGSDEAGGYATASFGLLDSTTPVPESGQLPMLVAGAALIGYLARRRAGS